jgi:hypothetical protein
MNHTPHHHDPEEIEELIEDVVHERKHLLEFILLVIVAAVFLLGITAGLSTIRSGKTLVQADNAALQKLHEYRNKPFGDLPYNSPLNTLRAHEDFSSSLPPSLPEPRSGIVNVSNHSSTLKQVVSVVTYGSGNDRKTIEHTLLVAQPEPSQ